MRFLGGLSPDDETLDRDAATASTRKKPISKRLLINAGLGAALVFYIVFASTFNETTPVYDRADLEEKIAQANWVRVGNNDQWTIEMPTDDLERRAEDDPATANNPSRDISELTVNGISTRIIEWESRPGRGMYVNVFVNERVDGKDIGGTDVGALTSARNRVVQNSGGTLCDTLAGYQTIDGAEYPTSDFIIGVRDEDSEKNGDNVASDASAAQRCEAQYDRIFQGRVVLSAQRQYVIMMGSNVADPPGLDRILNSLTIAK
jgi:hypothetical protein